MEEELWEEIGDLKAEVEELKSACASIQEYFKYLSDPIEAAYEVPTQDGDNNFPDRLKVFNIFKSVHKEKESENGEQKSLTDIFRIYSDEQTKTMNEKKFNEKKFVLRKCPKNEFTNRSKLSRKKRKYLNKNNIKQDSSIKEDEKQTWRDTIFDDSEGEKGNDVVEETKGEVSITIDEELEPENMVCEDKLKEDENHKDTIENNKDKEKNNIDKEETYQNRYKNNINKDENNRNNIEPSLEGLRDDLESDLGQHTSSFLKLRNISELVNPIDRTQKQAEEVLATENDSENIVGEDELIYNLERQLLGRMGQAFRNMACVQQSTNITLFGKSRDLKEIGNVASQASDTTSGTVNRNNRVIVSLSNLEASAGQLSKLDNKIASSEFESGENEVTITKILDLQPIFVGGPKTNRKPSHNLNKNKPYGRKRQRKCLANSYLARPLNMVKTSLVHRNKATHRHVSVIQSMQSMQSNNQNISSCSHRQGTESSRNVPSLLSVPPDRSEELTTQPSDHHTVQRTSNILIKLPNQSEPELLQSRSTFNSEANRTNWNWRNYNQKPPTPTYRQLSSKHYLPSPQVNGETSSLQNTEGKSISTLWMVGKLSDQSKMSLDPDKVLVSDVPPGSTIVSSKVIHSTTAEARIPAGTYVLDFMDYMNIAVLVVKEDD